MQNQRTRNGVLVKTGEKSEKDCNKIKGQKRVLRGWWLNKKSPVKKFKIEKSAFKECKKEEIKRGING